MARRIASWTLALAVACLLALPLAAQQPPPAPPSKQQPARKAKKVWTNEDLIELRRPSDKYIDEKEKAEKIARAQEILEKEKAAQKPGQPAAEKEQADDWLPKTVEECDKLIAEKKKEIEFQKERIEQTRMLVESASNENAREALTKRLNEEQAALKEAEDELAKLEEHLEKLLAAPPKPEKP
jgi:chromosome segregation ATPase